MHANQVGKAKAGHATDGPAGARLSQYLSRRAACDGGGAREGTTIDGDEVNFLSLETMKTRKIRNLLSVNNKMTIFAAELLPNIKGLWK